MNLSAPLRQRRLSTPRTIVYVFIILFALVFIYLVAGRGMRNFRVPTKSMIPTISPGETLVALNDDSYRRGDIVILKDPAAPDEYLCKRIVAVDGDTVSIAGGALYINGSFVSEPYVAEAPDYDLRPYTVPAGHVFVLGDNRNWSIDSHNWNEDPDAPPRVEGVPLDYVVGRVRYVYFPFKDARPIHSYPASSLAELAPAGNTAAKRVQ